MDFWEQDDVVREFAARPADHRLVELLARYPDPAATRVLDIGCAGGRNTVLLAERGFDVHALDASAAMVAATRRRVAAILDSGEADARVRRGRMDRLEWYRDASFDLVVALGVLHAAQSWEEWQRTARGLARIVRPGGRLLVSAFTPETDITGTGVRAVAGEPHLFEGLPGGAAILLSATALDEALAAHGFEPEATTTIGTTVLESGRRVSANGLYRR